VPAQPTPSQAAASRRNGARSQGPTTDAGKARAARNATRHGLSGTTFHLLPDEDEQEHAEHQTRWLQALAPVDLPEREAALAVIQARWRERRAERLEAEILAELFAAGGIAEEAERRAARAAGKKALSTLIRYRGAIQRAHDRALQVLDALRRRPSRPGAAVPAPAAVRSEPEPAAAAPVAVRSEPEAEPPLSRQQRRWLDAQTRKTARHAA
jgi:hypothetical protein